MAHRCRLLHLIKQNCLLKTSRTNLKLNNISVTSKMVKKVKMNLYLLKTSGSDCIPVVVLKKCPKLLTGFGMLVFFTILSLMEFQVKYLALFLLFSVISSFTWFWMGNLHKNIQLMLEFLEGPFLVLHFCYSTLMTFLMMLSVILLSMLILLSTLNVIRHLICVNN